MRKPLAIFARDLRRIVTNPVALVVTLGICVIPSLYAWFNIAANWDPYVNTSSIHVAVVNEDEGVTTSTTGTVNVGDSVVDALHENTQLGWVFTDEASALNGVRMGEYYAAIVIPSGFSRDLTSFLDGTVTKPKLVYYVNEKSNAVAPKVTDSGASAVEQTINQEFVQVVATTIAQTIKDTSLALTSKADAASGDLVGDLRSVEQSLSNTSDRMGHMEETIDSSREAIANAQDSLDALSGVVTGTKSTLAQATNSLAGTRSSAISFENGLVKALTKGSTTLTGLSSKAATGAAALQKALSAADKNLADAIVAVEDERNATEAILTALKSLRDSTSTDTQPLFDKPISQIEGVLTAEDELLAKLRQAEGSASSVMSMISGAQDDITSTISSSAAAIDGVSDNLSSATFPGLASALDTFSVVAGDLKGVLGGVSPAITSAQGVLTQLDGTLSSTKSSLGVTRDSLAQVNALLEDTATDISALRGSATRALADQVADIDAQSVGSFVSAPVKLSTETVYPVSNYGSGVAPFYTNLALWVGGLVLIAIIKLEVDDEEIGTVKPHQAYFGRWLLLVMLGLVQAVVVCVGDVAMLGIQCVDPPAFLLAGIIASFVYVNIIYSLSVSFKHIGKALCVVLVILQIPGSSGTYPIELMPGFFRAVHPWLPFTYGINAMREAIAGMYGNHYVVALAMLLLFVVPALAIGVGARRHLLNINALFDKKLAETDLMTCETNAIETRNYRLMSLVSILMEQDGYRQALIEKAAKFDARYPALIRRGIAALLFLPLGLLVLLFVIEAKIPVLVIWIVSIIALIAALIVVEYLHESLAANASLADLTHDEMQALIDEQLEKGQGHVIARLASKARAAREELTAETKADGGNAEGDEASQDDGSEGGERS